MGYCADYAATVQTWVLGIYFVNFMLQCLVQCFQLTDIMGMRICACFGWLSVVLQC